MAVSPLRRVIYAECHSFLDQGRVAYKDSRKTHPAIRVTCPACHRAVLACEPNQAQCCTCPHCQHVWDTPKAPPEPRRPLRLT
jgi:hypothetical protein